MNGDIAFMFGRTQTLTNQAPVPPPASPPVPVPGYCLNPDLNVSKRFFHRKATENSFVESDLSATHG